MDNIHIDLGQLNLLMGVKRVHLFRIQQLMAVRTISWLDRYHLGRLQYGLLMPLMTFLAASFSFKPFCRFPLGLIEGIIR